MVVSQVEGIISSNSVMFSGLYKNVQQYSYFTFLKLWMHKRGSIRRLKLQDIAKKLLPLLLLHTINNCTACNKKILPPVIAKISHRLQKQYSLLFQIHLLEQRDWPSAEGIWQLRAIQDKKDTQNPALSQETLRTGERPSSSGIRQRQLVHESFEFMI